MICTECLNCVMSACETKRKCIEADKLLRSLKNQNDLHSERFTSEHHETRIVADQNFNEDQSQEIVLEANPANNEGNNINHNPENNTRNLRMPEIRTIGSTKDFKCDACPFNSKRKKNLERHLLSFHLKLFTFNCSECPKQYTTHSSLKQHMVREHDENSAYHCSTCDQKFSCESLLKLHQRHLTCRPRKNSSSKKTPIEKSLQCRLCNFKTAHNFSLKQHISLVHLKIRKTFKCIHCEHQEFTNRVLLSHHLFNKHNLSHIRCSECNKAFSTEAQLKSHKETLKCNARKATEDDLEETESGVRCKVCNRNYKSRREWITHFFNHHKFLNRCDICGAQLATYASLRNHKKLTHDKNRRFKCSFDGCEKTFGQKHTCQYHEYI